MRLPILLLVFRIGLGLAQYDPNTTPVPILKQINRHNEDGSYSYGFEAADGSYKIESKHQNGEVFGKYGFVDDTGKLREIEYGATPSRGFEPAGTGINVPPAAVADNRLNPNEPEDDGQYREDPSIYHTDPQYTNGERYDPVPKPGYRHPQPAPRPRQPPQPVYQQQIDHRPLSGSVAAAYHQPAIPANLQPEYRPQYRAPYQPPQYQPQYQYEPAQSVAQPVPQSIVQRRYEGQPSPNAASLGSYSVQYRR